MIMIENTEAIMDTFSPKLSESLVAGSPPARSTEDLPGRLPNSTSPSGYLGPATVLDLNERERLVLVQWERAGRVCRSWARPAVAAPDRLQPGDVVLVITQNTEDFYLIGILSQCGRSGTEDGERKTKDRGRGTLPLFETQSGASVALAQSGGQEAVQIHSPQGALLVEYRPGSGKTLVNVESGDLEFVTHNGDIAFRSARKILLAAQRLETRAETVVEKAANVYQTVEELTQLQTGRMRTLVDGSCHLKARDAFLKAEQDFKVDGNQIHLG